jgi:hypothetical protein
MRDSEIFRNRPGLRIFLLLSFWHWVLPEFLFSLCRLCYIIRIFCFFVCSCSEVYSYFDMKMILVFDYCYRVRVGLLFVSYPRKWKLHNVIGHRSRCPVPSKAWVCGRSLSGIVGSNHSGGYGYLSAVCFQLEVSASGWSLVQRSLFECYMSEYDHEASIMRRPWSARSCCTIGKNIY